MTWKQAIRLLALADALEQEVAPAEKARGTQKFNMQVWFLRPKGSRYKRPSLTVAGCTTQRCAIGWMATFFPSMKIRFGLFFDDILYGGETAIRRFNHLAPVIGVTDQEFAHLFQGLDAYERTLDEEVKVLREFVASKWDAGEAL